MIGSTVLIVALFGWLAVSTGTWWLLVSLAGGVGWQWWRWARQHRA